jgi:hypothetical protein
METLELPRNKWTTQLDAFSTMHEGWPVSLEVLGSEIGAQPELRSVPLIGISAEVTARGAAVAVSVARSPDAQTTHVVRDVTRIFIQQNEEGADATLEIESMDGSKTLLRLGPAPSTSPSGT